MLSTTAAPSRIGALSGLDHRRGTIGRGKDGLQRLISIGKMGQHAEYT